MTVKELKKALQSAKDSDYVEVIKRVGPRKQHCSIENITYDIQWDTWEINISRRFH